MRRTRRPSLLSLLLAITVACGPPEDSAVVEGVPSELGVVLVTAHVDEVDASLQRRDELTGLTLARLELGLADLEHVVARVEGAPVAPGFERALLARAETWRAGVSLARHPEHEIALAVTLCPGDRPCEVLEGAGGVEEAVAEILGAAAGRCCVPPRPRRVRPGWRPSRRTPTLG